VDTNDERNSLKKNYQFLDFLKEEEIAGLLLLQGVGGSKKKKKVHALFLFRKAMFLLPPTG
jgi:PII-like signaling protein